MSPIYKFEGLRAVRSTCSKNERMPGVSLNNNISLLMSACVCVCVCVRER